MSATPPPPPTPRNGSPTPAEIYTAVGVALSWWEGSEDILMGLFRDCCAAREPIAFEAFVDAGRAGRYRLIKLVFKHYPGRFTVDEEATIRDAMGQLNALAPVRNQIAHGHVVKYSSQRNGSVVMDGHFIMPSLNERGNQVAPDPRYALTATEINDWTQRVRDQRARIMDANLAAMLREQNARSALGSAGQLTLSLAEQIAKGTISPVLYDFVRRP